MSKRTKLGEKATRIPDTRETHWEETIPQYLRKVEALYSESARSHCFAMLLQELLGMEPGFIENYCTGIEKYLRIRGKDRILKGKVDNLFGNVVIEFETNLPQKQTEAEEQLRRYVAILWSEEAYATHTPYLCIATDGVRFITYSPALAEPAQKDIAPENVALHVLEETDWTHLSPTEVYYWLDRYFLRQEILHPTSENIVQDFGMSSHAFQTATHALLALWQEIESDSAFTVIYDGWEKYLRLVYGSAVAGPELFVRHTYLATLAKLMSWMRIGDTGTEPAALLPQDTQIIEMLEGRLFKAHGIENLIEEDFFSWLARERAAKIGVAVTRRLFSLLRNYNLRELSEDVLKSLYQELVDPATRHDLGEYYTPDWLAQRMVCRLLDQNPQGALLDPACGSGTFLYLAIREKRARLGDSAQTLQHILDTVCGADIHPLAVIVAKTNYILALGDLLKKGHGQISLPVYLADTIKLPERWAKTQAADYEVTLNGWSIYLPEALLADSALYDQAIELAKEFARQSKGQRMEAQPFRNFLIAQHFPLVEDNALVQALYAIAQALKSFIDADRDTIWAFVLKNVYKPLFFKGRFDFVVGNPPWIAFRFLEPAYQEFLKRLITKEYRLLTGRGELITHLEIATLFLLRAADLYLKPGGAIAFVLPRSLFSADQHDGLRRGSFKFSENSLQSLFWRELWDLENVTPLFNVPACVLIADKGEIPAGPQHSPPSIAGQTLSGKLERKNASLAEAQDALQVEEMRFSLHTRGKRSFWAMGKGAGAKRVSYYKEQFVQGATIVPRSFWFVEVKPSALGFNPDLPPLQTAQRALEQAKEAYKSVFLKDTVESRFLYATLLSTDLLPFGHLDYRLVILPIEPAGDHYELLDAQETRQRGYLHLARWLDKVEAGWTKGRGTKAARISAIGWLDYRRKLTAQNPQAKYRVLYNTSGTFLTAAVFENKPIEPEINGQRIAIRGFAADTKTYYCELTNSHEAHYLLAVLNAPVIDRLIKPMQSRGLWGPRDIHKKPLELPIPKFDTANSAHQRLAELGQQCTAKVQQWLASGGAGKITSIGRLRGLVRQMLQDEVQEIDALVTQILKQGVEDD